MRNAQLTRPVTIMDAFINRLGLGFCDYCRVTELLDYTPEELTGKNIYNLCHGEDADKLRRSHLDRELIKN